MHRRGTRRQFVEGRYDTDTKWADVNKRNDPRNVRGTTAARKRERVSARRVGRGWGYGGSEKRKKGNQWKVK